MATQTKTQADSIDKATERVAEFNEKAIESSKKASIKYLDSYEKVVLTLADSYERTASATNVEWINAIAATQAGVTRQLNKAYVDAARELVS